MDFPKQRYSERKHQIFNVSSEERWGIAYFWPFFGVAFFLGIIAYRHDTGLSALSTSSPYPWIRSILLILIFCSAVGALAVSHLSYPRIHNLKVLLLGYLTFLLHGTYVFVRFAQIFNPVFKLLAEANHSFTLNLYGLIALNIFLILGIPSFTKYRFARSVLLSMVLGEGIFVFYLFLGFFGKVPLPGFALGPMGWILPLFAALGITLFSLKLVRNEYNLGGALAGLAWVYAIAACTRLSAIPVEHAFILEEIALVLASGLVLASMVGNWLMRMSHRLYYDPLTQIYNREYCEAILEERSNIVFTRPSSVAMFDIDRFKKVNDTYGHATGDRVLRYVADRLSRQVIPNGIACRYGGEEIAVFFPGLPINEAGEICAAVHHSIKGGGVESGRRRIRVTISAGVAELCDRYPTISVALKAADKALYEAKNTGRDKVVVMGRKRTVLK